MLSAIASGPAFTALVCRGIEKVSGRQLVDRSVYELFGKIVAVLLSFYIVLKIIDTLYWIFVLAPSFGFKLSDFYLGPHYGYWLLFTEIILCGVIPAAVLLSPKLRQRNGLLFGMFILDCIGITINRFVMTVQALATPVMPFDRWEIYIPTIYEWAPGFALIAYILLVISISHRYLPLFPRERELNPIR